MPLALTDKGYKPRLALVNSKRATHLIWHSGPTGTVVYRRLTPAQPQGDVEHEFETSSDGKSYGRVAAGSDDPAAPDAGKERVYVVWAELDTSGKSRIVVALSRNGGVDFDKPKAITKPFLTISHVIAKAEGKHAYIVWQGDRTPGTYSPRGVWLARTHDFGENWTVTRLGALHDPSIDYTLADPRDPYEIDLALGAGGKLVAIAFPFVKTATDVGGPVQHYGVELAVSKNNGRLFEFVDLQPSAPDLPGNGPSYDRIRLAMDESPIVHATWQSTLSWRMAGTHAYRQSTAGMLMYRQIRVPELIVRPELSKMPFVHPWEVWLPDQEWMQLPGEPPVYDQITLRGALERYSMAASTEWCAITYNKTASNVSPSLLGEFGVETSELVASEGHRSAVFQVGKDQEVFSLPLRIVEQRFGEAGLSNFALTALPSSAATPAFATVGLEKEWNEPNHLIVAAVFKAKGRGRNEWVPPAPTLVYQVTIGKLKPGEWAIAQIHSDPMNPKALIVLWEQGSQESPLGKTWISRSQSEGRTFD